MIIDHAYVQEARNDFDVGIWLFELSKAETEAEIRFMANSKTGFQCVV